MSETGDLVKRIYGNFRGVDFRGEEINIVRSPDSLNVWRNYKKTAGIETRPGMKKLTDFARTVNNIHFFNDKMILQCGTSLFIRVPDGIIDTFEEFHHPISREYGESFVFNGIWYYRDGYRYLCWDGKGSPEYVEGYVPTTSIGRKPAGGGTLHEDVNMLTGKRKNTFLADGTSYDYHLDADEIDSVDKVTVNGELAYEQDHHGTAKYRYEVHKDEGYIKFTGIAPPAPATDGQDNVVVEFTKTSTKHQNMINKCTLLQLFDNRVFVGGNEDYPNRVWHSSLNDPTYFSDLDYYDEGVDSARVNGIVAGNNALWVFREPSDANTTVFYHTPTIDADYGKIYPSQHSSITTGCIGKAINFNDDIIFFSDRGMEGISGDVTTEQVLAHRSSLIDSKLITSTGYKDMVLVEWEGYLFVFMGKRAFLADSKAMLTNENHAEYEWFYWEMEEEITCAKVHKGVLYLGTKKGVYELTDTEKALNSYWVTPKDKFGAPQKLKTTNKRGCVVEATGDISVYAKLEDTEFEQIGSYENITDYFVSRIKRKKFKDIQLKFQSNTRFSLETATLECFIGGYIKR